MPGSYGPVYEHPQHIPYTYAGYGSPSHARDGVFLIHMFAIYLFADICLLGGVSGLIGTIVDSRLQVRQARFERKMARRHRKKGRIGLKGLAVASACT